MIYSAESNAQFLSFFVHMVVHMHNPDAQENTFAQNIPLFVQKKKNSINKYGKK